MKYIIALLMIISIPAFAVVFGAGIGNTPFEFEHSFGHAIETINDKVSINDSQSLPLVMIFRRDNLNIRVTFKNRRAVCIEYTELVASQLSDSAFNTILAWNTTNFNQWKVTLKPKRIDNSPAAASDTSAGTPSYERNDGVTAKRDGKTVIVKVKDF